jgi:hypothetical protein
VKVLGDVAAGVGVDLGEQVLAVAREPVALPPDRIDHLVVTHG